MSLPLEDTVMREIGFGQHYNWFGGSGSCRYLRQEAIRKLPDAINKHAEAGEEIASWDNRMRRFLKNADRMDEEKFQQYSLDKVWQACSDVIRYHMSAFYPKNDMRSYIRSLEETYPDSEPEFDYEMFLMDGNFPPTNNPKLLAMWMKQRRKRW